MLLLLQTIPARAIWKPVCWHQWKTKHKKSSLLMRTIPARSNSKPVCWHRQKTKHEKCTQLQQTIPARTIRIQVCWHRWKTKHKKSSLLMQTIPAGTIWKPVCWHRWKTKHKTKNFSADADNTCWHYLETSVLTSMEDDAQKSTQLMQMISARSNWKNVCWHRQKTKHKKKRKKILAWWPEKWKTYITWHI